jgi:FAD/FMN-containing dehydrogenase
MARSRISLPSDDLLLGIGNGRSYGDVGINAGHTVIHAAGLDRYIAFDSESGLLECEAGMLLDEIVRDFLPQGWFLPVVPGTRFVSVGGAIANDVHGKNHHVAGTFGNQVESLILLRSDETAPRICSRDLSPELFRATIGGLGLTGFIVSARLRLRRLETGWMTVTTRRFGSLDEFFTLNEWAEARFPYTVAWIDCLSARNRKIRGVYMAGDHAARALIGNRELFTAAPRAHSVWLTPPFSLINRASLMAFNAFYYARAVNQDHQLQNIYNFFWPLDALLDWNRVYGPRGFYQYQCVLPPSAASDAASEILAAISRSGQGSFLAVLKTFGHHAPDGLLSFPRPGLTIALDFPNLGERTRKLFRILDQIVYEVGGAIYPAKDAVMTPELFASGHPQVAEFLRYKDQRFSSSLWRRLMETS